MSAELERAAAAQAATVRGRFFDDDGVLVGWPAKQSRQLAALDVIAQRFVPGVRYTEPEVNLELRAVCGDAVDEVTLRRGLVDFGLMSRGDGQYWRSGGTVDLDD